MIEELKEISSELEKEIKKYKKELKEKEKKFFDIKNQILELQKTEEDFIKEDQQRKKTFNGLTAKEWASFSRSVWNDLSSVRNKKHLDHGATFPEKLADRIIKMYSRIGDLVFDPFLGTGTTGLAAITLNRNFKGIELNAKYYEYSLNNLEDRFSSTIGLFSSLGDYNIFNGDCLKEIDQLEDESVQLTFTSPPYADLIHKVVKDRQKHHKNSAFVIENNATTKIYSESEFDLGNMAIPEYTEAIDELMIKLYNKTKVGGYNIWVVKDFRDMKNKSPQPYVDLHTIIANSGQRAGFKYQDLIIWDQNEQRRLVLLGYPSKFYVNQNNSFIVVLRKWEK